MEREKPNANAGAGLSIEDRLAKLKQIHKPMAHPRPPSGQRMMQQRAQVQRQPTGPLNPIDFQAELEKRAAEEKEKMDIFKAHEEKMKAFQQAKKNGGKPPLTM